MGYQRRYMGVCLFVCSFVRSFVCSFVCQDFTPFRSVSGFPAGIAPWLPGCRPGRELNTGTARPRLGGGTWRWRLAVAHLAVALHLCAVGGGVTHDRVQ